MGRTESVDTLVKGHDYKLFCRKNREGTLCVYRRGKSVVKYDLGEGKTLLHVRSTPHFIFALTHDWTERGKPVDWGLEPILARLKAIDLWNRDLAREVETQSEKADLSNRRQLHNECEAFAGEFRSQFAKTFNDYNTSTMRKYHNYKHRKDKIWR